jgi:hypothetical protein
MRSGVCPNAAAFAAGVLLLATGVALWSCGERPSPVDFQAQERSVFSQNGEDGVIQALFDRIGAGPRFAVEFGAADGVRASNVRNLVLHQGWDALLIEGDEQEAQRCTENYRDHPRTRCVAAWVFPGNVELLFEENGVPPDLDLLVIDIDSNDWYVWRAIRDFRPKVVQIEYNGAFAPPTRMVVDFHPMNYWDKSLYFGASIQSLYELGKHKGYELVYAESSGVNLFFVDAPYFRRFGIDDNSPERLYRPLRGMFRVEPDALSSIMNEDGTPLPPHDRDLVWEELRIHKRFLVGRR